MVAQRRFGPLIVAVFVALTVLIARLFQVQVLEHVLWARQAESLMSSSKVIPGERGRILDRDGNVLVEDEPMYQIELCYRDFRREHPIGILAHARSTIEMRAVPLSEAFEHRTEWTADLLHTSQADLRDLAAGKAWKSGGSPWPAAADKDREQCSRRAVDVRFYIGQLLDLDDKEALRLRKLEEPDRARSFLDVIADARSIASDALLARVQANVEAACDELARLTDILPAERDAAGAVGDARSRTEQDHPARTHVVERGSGPIERLLVVLEDVRSDVENEAADDLFQNAAGFDAGEVSTRTLQSAFDLDWIRVSLCWDRTRLEAWTASRREQRDARIELGLLPRMLVQVELGDEEHAPERLLDELARLWRADPKRDDEGRPPSWRKTDDLVVLSEIETLFADARLPRGVDVPALVLPFQDEDLRAAPADPNDPWRIVGMLSDLAGKDDSGEVEPLREPAATRFWDTQSQNRAGFESRETRDELARIVRALDRRHAAAADRLFASLLAAHAGGDGPTHLRFSEDRLRRAENEEKYVLIDQGNRPAHLFEEPPYELVERIARHPEHFGGFDVTQTTRRVQRVHDKAGRPLAGLLIGDVRKPQLREMLAQSDDERRRQELLYQRSRSDEEARELDALNGSVRIADVATGGTGIEAYLDRELRETPGSFETQGLEERARAGDNARSQPPRNGQDVVLTIDPKLQLAAQDLLAAPRMPNDEATDRTWFANPVGSILVLSLDGDVLAAASAPDEMGLEPAAGRDAERKYRRERTLQSPTFQPPGSVFKPFVAAYALAKRGFDPETKFECEDPNSTSGRFETMHCLEKHHWTDLHDALRDSCNAYFAQLGLRLDTDQCLDMMHTFGFGEPTGILCFGKSGRSGLIENTCAHQKRLAKQLDVRRIHLQFSNGLSVVEATPMQVGRAMAGIVTGSLPDVRLIRSIGGHEIPHVSRSLGMDEKSLACVRSALVDVVAQGTARVIGQAHLGFTVACKTGSADYRKFEAADPASGTGTKKLLKHTWIAGYFPAESPRAILVVFLHETAETSTRTSVYLALEFLESEAVKAFATQDLSGSAAVSETAGKGRKPLFDARRVLSLHEVRWFELDWHVLAIAVLLIACGLVFIHAMSDVDHRLDRHNAIQFDDHIQKMMLALPAFFVGLAIRPRWLRRNAHVVYALTLGLLLALFAVGTMHNGSRRWIHLPLIGFELQPSELAKVGLILALAGTLYRNRLQRAKDWGPPLAIAFVPMALVALQPDLGTAMTMAPITLGMLYLAGARAKVIGMFLFGTAVLAFCVVTFRIGVHDYQMQRVDTWMQSFGAHNLIEARTGPAFHSYHARLAIGNGGWTGQGIGEGVANEAGHLPERDCDSVFAVIAEELGLIGSVIVLVLYGLLIALIMGSASSLRDRFSRLAVGGIALYFAAHLFINVGVNLGLLPLTGLTLPLFSTGGSSLLVTFLVLGLALGLCAHREPSLDEDSFKGF